MRAVLIEEFGEPSGLRVHDRPKPAPAEGEVLIEVKAAGVNRSDLLSIRGLPITTLPRIPGRDFAGVVVGGDPELEGVSVWGVGGAELGFSRDGSHAEFLTLQRSAVAPMPDVLSFAEAAAAGLPFLTAGIGLLELTEVAQGDIVLVSGAAGGVGRAATSVATWRGAMVIGLVKDAAERESVEGGGLSAVIETGGGDLVEEITSAAGGDGVDIVFDTVGAALFRPQIECLRPGGRMIVITAPAQSEVAFDLARFYRSNQQLLGISTSAWTETFNAGLLNSMRPGFESGDLVPAPVVERVPLTDATRAYALSEQVSSSRVLIVPSA